jgi:hypothetical protein
MAEQNQGRNPGFPEYSHYLVGDGNQDGGGGAPGITVGGSEGIDTSGPAMLSIIARQALLQNSSFSDDEDDEHMDSWSPNGTSSLLPWEILPSPFALVDLGTAR